MEGSVIVVSANTAWFLWNFEKHLLIKLIETGYTVHTISKDDPVIFQKLRNIGCTPHGIHLDRKGMNPIKEALSLFRYYALLSQIRPIILLNFTIKPVIYGSFASIIIKIPTINTITGLGTGIISGGFRAWLLLLLYRLSLRKASYTFTLNETDRLLFKESSIGVSGIIDTCPGAGVDTGHFAYSRTQEGPISIFIFVGRILRDKGIIEYITAAKQLSVHYPTTRFQILGSIDEGNPTTLTQVELEQYISSCSAIEYLGVATDVRPYLEAADCVVLPSYREGLATSLLEAMSVGRPVVTTTAPGCKDIVIDGVNGYTVAIKDIEALREAMEKILTLSSAERTLLGIAGRERVMAKFSKEQVVEKYLSAIGNLTKDFYKK